MNCPFCERRMLQNDRYSCPCTPDFMVCRYCATIECHECNKKRELVQDRKCGQCYETVRLNDMLVTRDRYYRYCKECCFVAYRKANQGVVRIGHFSDFKKVEVENYLRKFCYQCHKNIKKLQRQQKEEPRKLQQNLCSQCLQPKKDNNKQIPPESQNEPQPSLNPPIPQPQPQISKKTRQQLYKIWQEKQNVYSSFIRCLNCDMIISDYDKQSVITEEMVICSFCCQRSKFTEGELEKSRIRGESRSKKEREGEGKGKEKKEDMVKMESSKKPKQRPESDYSALERASKLIEKIEKNKKEEKPETKIEGMQEQKPKEIQKQKQKPIDPILSPQELNEQDNGQKIQVRQIEQKKSKTMEQKPKPKKKHSDQPEIPTELLLKKSDSQQKFQNLSIEIEWTNDSETVQCCKCGVSIEAVYSIWEEEENAPFCKCCYADLLENLRREMERRAGEKRLRYRAKDEVESHRIARTENKTVNNYMREENVPRTDEKPKSRPKFSYFDQKDTIEKKIGMEIRPKQPEKQNKFMSSTWNQATNFPQTKKFEQFRHSPITVPQRQPITRTEHFRGTHFPSHRDTMIGRIQAQKKEYRNCAICNKIGYISDRYQFQGKAICIQCQGNISLPKKTRNVIIR